MLNWWQIKSGKILNTVANNKGNDFLYFCLNYIVYTTALVTSAHTLVERAINISLVVTGVLVVYARDAIMSKFDMIIQTIKICSVVG